ncbi:hypothetical protein Emed_004465 [Eimeria media]
MCLFHVGGPPLARLGGCLHRAAAAACSCSLQLLPKCASMLSGAFTLNVVLVPQLYARLLRCLCTFPAASPVAVDLLQGLIEDLPSAIRVSSDLAAAAEAVVSLHEVRMWQQICWKKLGSHGSRETFKQQPQYKQQQDHCFYAAEAALLRDRRRTLHQLQPTHIRDLRRAYEATEEGHETWGELLHFLSRVEEALNKAEAGPPSSEGSIHDQQQQQEREQQQEEQQQHRQVVAHTYVSGSGHRAEPVLLRRGLKSST